MIKFEIMVLMTDDAGDNTYWVMKLVLLNFIR